MPGNEVNFRRMTTADIPAGMRLKDIAGWNQTPADWERFLRASPEGCFAAEVEGRVVGTATTIVYEGRFAWIGMVLVDPEQRGRGIGTRLLERTIEYLDEIAVPTLKLDATPQGKPIYEKLGFVVEYEIERWKLQREPAAQRTSPAAPPRNLHRLLRLDREVFGADRSDLLRSLYRDAPEYTLAAEFLGELTAYALGRRGTRADHLGPWISRDEASAREMLDEFLRRSTRETIFVDVMRGNPFARVQLRSRGFEFSRPLTRMYRGPNKHPGCPGLVCSALGPEFG
ncbi:MAG: GNAT family N-acetyltransferase [Acidobacteria bacterium]|nr:GNAT family N-acetyltransferase [Acidobacteriota bacterium]